MSAAEFLRSRALAAIAGVLTLSASLQGVP